MGALYYLCAILAFTQLLLMITFDLWVYQSKKDLNLVLNVWMNRHKSVSNELSKYQVTFLKTLCLLERVLIFVIVITLSSNIILMLNKG